MKMTGSFGLMPGRFIRFTAVKRSPETVAIDRICRYLIKREQNRAQCVLPNGRK
jgi:hypothetical protein